jgi:endonuclease YncB( thermonuclease family)
MNFALVRVTDGDTIVVSDSLGEERIRFCGIDAPERDQPMGDEATALLENLLAGVETVNIVPVDRDRYDRLVGEVFISTGNGDIFLQEELLKAGLAYVYEQYVGGCPNANPMREAQAIAQDANAGVWGDPSAIPPWEWRRQ